MQLFTINTDCEANIFSKFTKSMHISALLRTKLNSKWSTGSDALITFHVSRHVRMREVWVIEWRNKSWNGSIDAFEIDGPVGIPVSNVASKKEHNFSSRFWLSNWANVCLSWRLCVSFEICHINGFGCCLEHGHGQGGIRVLWSEYWDKQFKCNWVTPASYSRNTHILRFMPKTKFSLLRVATHLLYYYSNCNEYEVCFYYKQL